MTDIITTHADEKSTYAITVYFKDEDGDAVVPDSMKWTLTDRDGNIINSREDVEVSSLAAAEDIVLTDDDLQITGTDDDGLRILTITATYTSALGAGLALKGAVTFAINDLKKIS